MLGKTAIADFGKAPQTLDDAERVFDLGTHAGLGAIDGLPRFGEWVISASLFVDKILGTRSALAKGLLLAR